MQISWDENTCCHAGGCVGSLPEVFKIQDGRFAIDPSAAPMEEILSVVARCPSGALRVAHESFG